MKPSIFITGAVAMALTKYKMRLKSRPLDNGRFEVDPA